MYNRYPGDPKDVNYVHQCPKPRPATLNVIGVVCKSFELSGDGSPYNLRSFELKTSIYGGKDMIAEYTVLCFYRHGNYTPCPYRRALVSVFGQIVGTHTVSGALALLVDDVVF